MNAVVTVLFFIPPVLSAEDTERQGEVIKGTPVRHGWLTRLVKYVNRPPPPVSYNSGRTQS